MADLDQVSAGLLLQQVTTQQTRIADDMAVIRDAASAILTRLALIDARNTGADKDHEDYETRLRSLERFRWTLVGIAVVVGILAGYLGDYLGHVGHP